MIAWELTISNTEVNVYYFFILMDFFAKVKILSLIFVKSYPHSSKFFDRWFDNFEANCKIREEDVKEDAIDAMIKTDEEMNKVLGLSSPSEVKNPHRFL